MIPILFAAAIFFDSSMSEDELEKCGISRLNLQERRALRDWIEEHYEKKISTSKKSPELQENLKNGHYIRLSDHSLWQIDPKDTPITQGWITQVEIEITESGDPNYPYFLKNSLTCSQVKAKKIKE